MAQNNNNNNQFYINEMFNDGRFVGRGIKLKEKTFKENCGNLSADKREERTNFIQNNKKCGGRVKRLATCVANFFILPYLSSYCGQTPFH